MASFRKMPLCCFVARWLILLIYDTDLELNNITFCVVLFILSVLYALSARESRTKCIYGYDFIAFINDKLTEKLLWEIFLTEI